MIHVRVVGLDHGNPEAIQEVVLNRGEKMEFFDSDDKPLANLELTVEGVIQITWPAAAFLRPEVWHGLKEALDDAG